MNVAERVQILFLAANPDSTSRLDLEEELRSVENELRAVEYRDSILLTAAHAVRPDDLVRLLRKLRPAIVHFSGHGAPDGIILRNDQAHIAVDGNALARLFRDRGVQMVVLNACFSDEQAKSLAEVVSAVIGTTAAVGDEAARRFSVAFYRTLGDGHSIADAFRDGGDAVDIHMLDDVFKARGNVDLVLCGNSSTADRTPQHLQVDAAAENAAAVEEARGLRRPPKVSEWQTEWRFASGTHRETLSLCESADGTVTGRRLTESYKGSESYDVVGYTRGGWYWLEYHDSRKLGGGTLQLHAFTSGRLRGVVTYPDCTTGHHLCVANQWLSKGSDEQYDDAWRSKLAEVY